MDKLTTNGFVIKYTHPNLLFISWKHWIPSYVRTEFKKKTGKNIDGFGEKSAKKLQTLLGSYYLRLQVYDRPGVLADLTAVFRDEGVSVEALLQRGRNPDGSVPVVLTTHETSEKSIQRSVSEFEKLENVVEKPCILHIENFSE